MTDPSTVISAVILFVILFTVVAVALPEAQTAGDVLNATNLPFASFFASDGIVFLAIMGGILIAVVAMVIAKKAQAKGR